MFEIKRDEFNKFLTELAESKTLFAPLKKGLVKYYRITPEDVPNIFLEKNSYFPIKEYFFRKKEVLFKFKNNDVTPPVLEFPERIFFGLRRCDLNGIMHQDKVFTQQINDPYYKAQRENSYLIGYHCWEAPSKYCFCGTLDLKDFYDLMVYNKGDHYLIEVGSEKGTRLIEKYKKYFKPSEVIISKEEKHIKGADRLLNPDIKDLYDNPKWEKGVSQCLSCAACTSLCPTCYCFEFKDNTKTSNPKEGERVREWSSCQVQEFTRVAGDHVFRKKREERFKHRIYHQLEYFKEKNGINLCTGCGRCIEGCPTRIDFVEIINEMKK